MNMWTQGIDPQLDFHDINKIRDMYERCTKMKVGERQPDRKSTRLNSSHR